MDTKPLKAKEVAKILGLHYSKIYVLIENGLLQATNVSTGGKRPSWRISQEALDNFVEGRKSTSER